MLHVLLQQINPVINIKGAVKVMLPIFFSETTITVTKKFIYIYIYIYIMDTSVTKSRLFFHKVVFIINTLVSSLHVVLYAGSSKFFAEASEVFVFQLVIFRKTSSECVLQRARNMEVMENNPPHCCKCLPCAQTGVWPGIFMQGKDLIHCTLGLRPLNL